MEDMRFESRFCCVGGLLTDLVKLEGTLAMFVGSPVGDLGVIADMRLFSASIASCLLLVTVQKEMGHVRHTACEDCRESHLLLAKGWAPVLFMYEAC